MDIFKRGSGCLGAGAFTLLSFLVVANNSLAQDRSAGETPKRPVTETHWGAKVTEDYRWLENWSDPQVKEWSSQQNKRSRQYLDNLPSRNAIAEDIKKLYASSSSHFFSLTQIPGMLYALKEDPKLQQPVLVTIGSVDDTASAKIVFDPNKYDTTGLTTIDFYVPSRDGRFVAVSLSEGGSEDGNLHILEVSSGKRLPDIIPHVTYPTAGGSIAWNEDASGFWYTRYPQAGERPETDRHFFQQVYYHKLGTPVSADNYEMGKDLPRIAEIVLDASFDGKSILATVENGDGGEYSHYLKGPTGKWLEITKFSDQITDVQFGHDQALYLLSHAKAPQGKILRLPLTDPELTKTTVAVKQGDASIKSFTPTVSKLFVTDMVGGPSRLRMFDLRTGRDTVVPTLPVSSVGQPLWVAGDQVLFTLQSYLEPQAYYRFDGAVGTVAKTALQNRSTVDYSSCEVVRETAVSKDGAQVPMNIIRKKGASLNGANPTILYGYGGFGLSQAPGFSMTMSIWLNQGGVYVIANLRGGSEFGEEWHEQGRLTQKQHVFDDFLACAEYLIKAGYTNPSKLAIQGGSNGGLLMGAALTQRPDLFRAVTSRAGIYDMLRVELSPNGTFNTTEFGTVKDSAQFAALYSYSPYHHVVDGKAYPAVLFTVGENDGRVDPMQSRKMTARLQEATTSGNPILLRVSSTSGHGIGSSLSEEIMTEADVYAFLFDQLGVTYRPGK